MNKKKSEVKCSKSGDEDWASKKTVELRGKRRRSSRYQTHAPTPRTDSVDENNIILGRKKQKAGNKRNFQRKVESTSLSLIQFDTTLENYLGILISNLGFTPRMQTEWSESVSVERMRLRGGINCDAVRDSRGRRFHIEQKCD
jgi:hypothetical protein